MQVECLAGGFHQLENDKAKQKRAEDEQWSEIPHHSSPAPIWQAKDNAGRVRQVISPNILAASNLVADLRQRGVVLPAGEEGPEPVVEEGGITACGE